MVAEVEEEGGYSWGCDWVRYRGIMNAEMLTKPRRSVVAMQGHDKRGGEVK